ncbi:MAG: AraC family transcriptional regulator [Rhizobium sp.]|nr:MAG: AraC family transcriptional regulator [Rhizobium sp.]
MPVNIRNVPAYDHHVIAYCTTVGGRLIQKRAGKVHDGRLSIGMSVVMPAGYEASWEGDFPASTRIRVPLELVTRASEEIGGEVELLNNFGARDTNVECFARLFADELDKPPHPAQRLIIDAVSCAVVVHLLRNYNAVDAVTDAGPPSLTARTIGKIVSYIEDNMHSTIGLLELAAIAGVSRFHFARLFKNSLGETPMSYVERMRIERAKNLIQQGRLALVDVALTVGFADQSHFTRRFHRHMGCTPAAYARNMGLRLQPRR